ncbi:glycosyltransferase [Mucilaginibacter sp.]|uniref:glycosyltransferase n=1 Tax=Mucilaginibacter sp. TaxID=1882438 RepID=UPI003D121AD6
MKSIPDISVIIPNYNHERFLRKRIDSVLAQSFQNFEIIILDDCSSDNSRAIIETYRCNAKVSHIVYNNVNSGSTFVQWCKGLTLAIGKYIWIAESDDYASTNFLEVLFAPFNIISGLVISYCRSTDVDENGNLLGLTLHADKMDAIKWTNDYVATGISELSTYLKYRNTIPNASAVLFKKPADFERYLNTSMRYCGDWYFWQALLKDKGSKIAYSSQPLNFFRTHVSSTRSLELGSTAEKELQRFGEYKTFVPKSFFNPFDQRFRWMMAEWIDRGVPELLKATHYYYYPLLHPALIARYYMYLIKNYFFPVKERQSND